MIRATERSILNSKKSDIYSPENSIYQVCILPHFLFFITGFKKIYA